MRSAFLLAVAASIAVEAAASSITIELATRGNARPVAIELRKADSVVRTARVEANQRTINFRDVAPGRYVVLAKGSSTHERHAVDVELKQGENKSVRMNIAPFRVDVRARMGGTPLANPSVRLRTRDWESGPMRMDDQGKATIVLWQGGAITATLFDDEVMTAPFVISHELREVDGEWLLDVPLREITGTVIDGPTGEPVPNATIKLRVHDVDATTQADERGRFRFVPAPYGQHTLSGASEGHLPTRVSYSFADPEQSRRVSIRLDRLAKVKLNVLRGRTPLAGAKVLRVRDGALEVSHTDSAGIANVPIGPDQSIDVYVIPHDGSFGVTRLRPRDNEATLRVGEGSSRIVVTTGRAGTAIAMRYDNWVVPAEIVAAMVTSTESDGRVVFERMPTGAYEFWPAGYDGERVKLTAVPGENSVDLGAR